MKIHVKYFASIRETLGLADETLHTHAPTIAALRDELLARGGAYAVALLRGKAVRVAINRMLSHESTPLQDGAEVAFFPPVTGG